MSNRTDDLAFWLEQCDRLDDEHRSELAEVIRLYLITHLQISQRAKVYKELREISKILRTGAAS